MNFDNFDNRTNLKLKSPIPDATKTSPCILGIDEAGRGPVLGPMVYATCFCSATDKSVLNAMGFADSKTLTEEQREALFEKLSAAPETFGWIAHVLSPNYISNSMLKRNKYNLNQISHDTAMDLIQTAIDLGANISEVYVDTVGDPGVYQAKLKQVFPHLEITVAKKADSTYPIVSAASICAKVARDRVVAHWKFLEDVGPSTMEYGSGYPADPKTKQFLADSLDHLFGFTQFVRFSWSTADIILQDKAATVRWEDDEEEADKKKADLKNVPSITSFFKSPQNTDDKKLIINPHRFFTECGLKPTLSLQ